MVRRQEGKAGDGGKRGTKNAGKGGWAPSSVYSAPCISVGHVTSPRTNQAAQAWALWLRLQPASTHSLHLSINSEMKMPSCLNNSENHAAPTSSRLPHHNVDSIDSNHLRASSFKLRASRSKLDTLPQDPEGQRSSTRTAISEKWPNIEGKKA